MGRRCRKSRNELKKIEDFLQNKIQKKGSKHSTVTLHLYYCDEKKWFEKQNGGKIRTDSQSPYCNPIVTLLREQIVIQASSAKNIGVRLELTQRLNRLLTDQISKLAAILEIAEGHVLQILVWPTCCTKSRDTHTRAIEFSYNPFLIDFDSFLDPF